MKSYTDLEQSKKLAEILPLDSADMGWDVFADDSVRCLPINDWDLNKDGSSGVKFIPAWSLAALFNYLCEIDFFPEIDADESGVTMNINYYDGEDESLLVPIHNIKVKAESFIDACVEMIFTLKEKDLL